MKKPTCDCLKKKFKEERSEMRIIYQNICGAIEDLPFPEYSTCSYCISRDPSGRTSTYPGTPVHASRALNLDVNFCPECGTPYVEAEVI